MRDSKKKYIPSDEGGGSDVCTPTTRSSVSFAEENTTRTTTTTTARKSHYNQSPVRFANNNDNNSQPSPSATARNESSNSINRSDGSINNPSMITTVIGSGGGFMNSMVAGQNTGYYSKPFSEKPQPFTIASGTFNDARLQVENEMTKAQAADVPMPPVGPVTGATTGADRNSSFSSLLIATNAANNAGKKRRKKKFVVGEISSSSNNNHTELDLTIDGNVNTTGISMENDAADTNTLSKKLSAHANNNNNNNSTFLATDPLVVALNESSFNSSDLHAIMPPSRERLFSKKIHIPLVNIPQQNGGGGGEGDVDTKNRMTKIPTKWKDFMSYSVIFLVINTLLLIPTIIFLIYVLFAGTLVTTLDHLVINKSLTVRNDGYVGINTHKPNAPLEIINRDPSENTAIQLTSMARTNEQKSKLTQGIVFGRYDDSGTFISGPTIKHVFKPLSNNNNNNSTSASSEEESIPAAKAYATPVTEEESESSLVFGDANVVVQDNIIVQGSTSIQGQLLISQRPVNGTHSPMDELLTSEKLALVNDNGAFVVRRENQTLFTVGSDGSFYVSGEFTAESINALAGFSAEKLTIVSTYKQESSLRSRLEDAIMRVEAHSSGRSAGVELHNMQAFASISASRKGTFEIAFQETEIITVDTRSNMRISTQTITAESLQGNLLTNFTSFNGTNTVRLESNVGISYLSLTSGSQGYSWRYIDANGGLTLVRMSSATQESSVLAINAANNEFLLNSATFTVQSPSSSSSGIPLELSVKSTSNSAILNLVGAQESTLNLIPGVSYVELAEAYSLQSDKSGFRLLFANNKAAPILDISGVNTGASKAVYQVTDFQITNSKSVSTRIASEAASATLSIQSHPQHSAGINFMLTSESNAVHKTNIATNPDGTFTINHDTNDVFKVDQTGTVTMTCKQVTIAEGGNFAVTGQTVFNGLVKINRMDFADAGVSMFSDPLAAQTLRVQGNLALDGSLRIGNELICDGDANFQGNMYIKNINGGPSGGSLQFGPNGDVKVFINSDSTNVLNVDKNVAVHKDLSVGSSVTVTGDAEVNGTLLIANSGNGAGVYFGADKKVSLKAADNGDLVTDNDVVMGGSLTITRDLSVYGTIFSSLSSNPGFSINVIKGTPPSPTTDELGATNCVSMGKDGAPIIATYDSRNKGLRMVHCLLNDCSKYEITLHHYDPAGVDDIGRTISITTTNDDGLVIMVYSSTQRGLIFAKCGDVPCTTTSRQAVLYSSGQVGSLGIITGQDGNPLIFFESIGQLHAIHCTATDCSSYTSVGALTPGGLAMSVTVAGDGYPTVSHYTSDGKLWLLRCSTVDCNPSSGPVTNINLPAVPVIPTASQSFSTCAMVGRDGFNMIAFFDLASTRLAVIHCNDLACSGLTSADVHTLTTVPAEDISCAIGADGMAIMAYRTSTITGVSMRVSHCSDDKCTKATSVLVDDGTRSLGPGVGVGKSTAMMIGTDRQPLIAYGVFSGASDPRLLVAHCSNQFCIPFMRMK